MVTNPANAQPWAAEVSLRLGEPSTIPGPPKIPGIHWCITLKQNILEKLCYVHTKPQT